MSSSDDPAGREQFGTVILRDAWRHRRAGVGGIDPGQIRQHRFHHEPFALAVALLTLIAGVAVAFAFGSHQIALLVVGAMILQVVTVHFQVKALVGRAAEVTSSQFAGIHRIVQQAADALATPPLRVFVVQDPNPNALSFGFAPPFGIVLTSGLIEALDEDELLVVVAHEIGHIRFGHTRITLLFGGVDVSLGIPLLQVLIRAPFLWWMRCTELSADRAAFAVSGRLSRVVSALTKVAVGPGLYAQMRPEALARQADEFFRGPWAVISQLQASHPPLVARVQQVVDFAGPTEPQTDAERTERPANQSIPGPQSSGSQAGDRTTVLGPAGTAMVDTTLFMSGAAPERGVTAEPARSPSEAWLAVSLPSGGVNWFQMPGPWVTVGQDPSSDLVVADPSLAGQQLGIAWAGGEYRLRHLGSAVPTQLNGDPISEAPLVSGDEISVGNTRIVFSIVQAS